MTDPAAPQLTALGNGARVVVVPMTGRETVAVSVFVRTGSQHESRHDSGISHVVEHMAFKGTATRDCQRINLDAEALGAEVNAHTDKDHTAFHIEGLAADLPTFVELLADIVLNPSFPADELERERQVLQHEFTEFEEDPVNIAFECFDRACYGAEHAAGRPVIGKRANLDRLTRDDLPAFVALLADIVLNSSFPAEELERERQVIEHEFTEFEDDPAGIAPKAVSTARRNGSKSTGPATATTTLRAVYWRCT